MSDEAPKYEESKDQPRMRFNGNDFELVIPINHTNRTFARGVLSDAVDVLMAEYARRALAEQEAKGRIQKISGIQGLKNFVAGKRR